MSNLWNTSKAKHSFRSVIENTSEEEKVEDMIPKFWKPVESTELSNRPTMRSLAKSLKDRNIPLYKARGIPTMVDVPATSVISPLLSTLMVPGARLRDTVKFPGGENDFIPTYLNQDWYAENYDLPLLKQIMYRQITLGEEIIEGREHHMLTNEPFLSLLWKSAKTTSYGNGSLIGQVERLASMWRVKRGEDGYFPSRSLVSGYDLSDSSLPLETLSKFFERYLPLGPASSITYEGGWVGLTQRPSAYLKPYDPNTPEDSDYDWLPQIRSDSSAGLPYAGKTKRETVTEALAIADQFMLILSSIIKKNLTAPRRSALSKSNDELRQLLEDYWYLSCGMEFPKGERYEHSKWLTKTRNIWSSPFPTHLMMSMVSWPVLLTSPNCLTFDTPSLYGFSPFHGGMDKFVTKLESADKPISFVYADNYYILHVSMEGKKTWYSLDLVRGESQTTKEDAQLLAYYLLTRGHITEEGNPAFSATWAFLALFILPNMCVDSSGLLGNIQFQIPGQGSGNSWTFLLNHLKVSLFDHRYMPLVRGSTRDRPTDDSFKKLCKSLGINFTIERVIENLDEEFAKCKNQAKLPDYFSGVDYPPPDPPYNLELDLLGWSAVWSGNLNLWLPVLEAKRLAESIALPKGPANRKADNTDYIIQNCYALARMEAARMVGAWQYWPVDIALRERAQEIRSTLIKKRVGVNAVNRAMEKAVANQELAQLLMQEDIDLTKPVDSTVLVNLMSGQPTMTQDQLNGMDARNKYTYNTPKPTVSGVISKSDINLLTLPYARAVLKVLGDFKFSELELNIQDNLRKIARSAREEIDRIHDMFLGVGTSEGNRDIIPDVAPNETTNIEEVANPVGFYRIPSTLPAGALFNVTGHGPGPSHIQGQLPVVLTRGDAVNSNHSRSARRKRNKK